MLARLQRFTTIGLLLLALAWAVLGWRTGHPVGAAIGAILVVLGYAVVLAAEFALLRCARGDDPTPPATVGQLCLAWLGEVRAAPLTFCWRQPFRSRRWPDELPPSVPRRRGVLLVHGFVCNRGFWNGWRPRLRAAGVPCVAVDLEPVFGSLDDYVPAIEVAVRRLEAATGLAPVVVAHSMGGLAVRRWWADHPDARVHHAITIGTPHHGTWLARWAQTDNGREMAIGSAWLGQLAAREPAGRAARFTCFYGHCDNIVFPPATATLPGADNRHLAGSAHVQMASRREPFDELLRRLG